MHLVMSIGLGTLTRDPYLALVFILAQTLSHGGPGSIDLTVARSSTEATTTAAILWLKTLAQTLMLHARTEHMELDVFFVREKVVQNQLTVQHIPALDQTTDVLTKPLP